MTPGELCILSVLLLALYARSCSAISANEFPACQTTPPPGSPPFSAESRGTEEPQWQRCPGLLNATKEQMNEVAWKFAPFAFFHPLEQFYLGRMEEWLQHASIYDATQEKLGASLDELLLLRLSQEDPILGKSLARNAFMSIRNTSYSKEGIFGSPFVGNRSTAHLYAHVGSHVNYTQKGLAAPFFNINYMMWYPHNGCSNQKLIIQNNKDEEQQLEYYACDFGVHEGDWERVSVTVCGDLQTVLRVQYSEHEWEWETDCFANGGDGTAANPGDCVFHDNTTHPLAFISLNSHAAYPRQAREFVYAQFEAPQFPTVKALQLVDRPLKGPRYFEPTKENIILLDTGNVTINQTVLIQRLFSRNASAPTFADPDGATWISWDGRWGSSYFSGLRELQEPVCLYDGATREGSCPSNLVFNIARLLLGLATSPGLDSLRGALESVGSQAQLDTPGPNPFRHRYYWDGWSPTKPSVFIRQNQALRCADESKLVDVLSTTDVLPENTGALGSAIMVLTLFGIITMCLCLITTFGHKNIYRRLLQLDPKLARNRRARSCLDHCRDFIRSIPKISCAALVIVILGGLVLFEGLNNSLNLVSLYIPDDRWETVDNALRKTFPVIVAVDLLALCNAFFNTGAAFEHFCVDHANMCHGCMRRHGWWIQAIIIFLLGCTTLFNAVAMIYGSLFLGIHFAFINACDNLKGIISADTAGVCVNLEEFGFPDVFCGDDFTVFCNRWRAVDPQQVLLAAFLIMIAQLMLIAVGGMHLQRFLIFEHMRVKGPHAIHELFKLIEPDAGHIHTEKTIRGATFPTNSKSDVDVSVILGTRGKTSSMEAQIGAGTGDYVSDDEDEEDNDNDAQQAPTKRTRSVSLAKQLNDARREVLKSGGGSLHRGFDETVDEETALSDVMRIESLESIQKQRSKHKVAETSSPPETNSPPVRVASARQTTKNQLLGSLELDA